MAAKRSVDDVKTLLRSCKGLSSRQRMDFYDSWAETYEQDSHTMNYTAPHQVVDFLNANFSGNPKEAQVLDVACGSGLAAKLMAEHGFRNFVGIDGSKGMLEEAAKTKLYQDLKQAILGPEPLPAQSGMFDIVIIVGALRDGFVPVSVIPELCKAAKPGGLICMSRIELKSESGERYAASMEREMQLMETQRLWTHVASKELKGYMMNVYDDSTQEEEQRKYLDGIIYLYRKSL
ncbi:methyltransferase-like protein 27 [Salarias fasciatus]|uniref:Methyltransferase-like protein 27 n=1 Tax=Salarias fasciatus TaxID=181472 RepID=A0A672FXM4_SALFA|nr:methyltransferase-like protein 27 [Salarias fasciatus]XP_029957761.1 methyltransferase-like protein 27 [Salarias fasciatus]